MISKAYSRFDWCRMKHPKTFCGSGEILDIFSVCSLRYISSLVFDPSTESFHFLDALIYPYVLNLGSTDTTSIKYTSNAYLYYFAQPSVSSHPVEIFNFIIFHRAFFIKINHVRMCFGFILIVSSLKKE